MSRDERGNGAGNTSGSESSVGGMASFELSTPMVVTDDRGALVRALMRSPEASSGEKSGASGVVVERATKVVLHEPPKKVLTVDLTQHAVADFEDQMRRFLQFNDLDSWEPYLDEDLRVRLRMSFASPNYRELAKADQKWWLLGPKRVSLDVLCTHLRELVIDPTESVGKSLCTALENVKCSWYAFEDMKAARDTFANYITLVDKVIQEKRSMSPHETILALEAIIKSLRTYDEPGRKGQKGGPECYRKRLAEEAEAWKKERENEKDNIDGASSILDFVSQLNHT